MTEHSEFRVTWEWLPAPDVRAPELAATWARLQMHVRGACPTLVEDVESGSARRSVFVPLYPLAEWIAYHWWLLGANARPATAFARLPRRDFFEQLHSKYRDRHGMRGAADGFLWPDMFVLPEGNDVRLVWRADDYGLADRSVRYLASGEALVDRHDVQRTLSGVVESVLARLAEQGVKGTALEDEWRAVQGVTTDEAAFCTAAARLGLDPFSEAEPYEQQILEAGQALGDGELLGDFLDSVDPTRIGLALEWVSNAADEVARLRSAKVPRRLLSPQQHAELRRKRHGMRPWEAGWQRAGVVRQSLGLGPTEPITLDDIVANVVRDSSISEIQALGGTPEAGTSAVVLSRTQRAASRKFTLARALWHITAQERRFLVTSAHTDRQKEERAFAAELVAPAAGISEVVNGDVVAGLEDDVLEDISARYDVSSMLVKHQIENQLLGHHHYSGDSR